MAVLNTRGLLCPACKVIIDYGAVQAAAFGIAAVASSSRLTGAASNLAHIADVACQAEVEILRQNKFSQEQFDRMNKLWMDSCDRAKRMNQWRLSGLSNEADIADLLDVWAAEMQRVPREVAENKVPD